MHEPTEAGEIFTHRTTNWKKPHLRDRSVMALDVSVSHPGSCHVELDGSNHNQNQQTAQRDLC